MCGIAGCWGEAKASELANSMLDILAHRGPNGRGVWPCGETAAIGSVRLAIRDLSRGSQPIVNETGTHALVANGEIYNLEALRAELGSRGHRFWSHADSEAILHLFEEEDVSGFAQLDGMYACAVATRDRLVLARDPMGIKPLYLAWNGQRGTACCARFASELKALVGSRMPVRPLMPGEVFDSEAGILQPPLAGYAGVAVESAQQEASIELPRLAAKLQSLIEKAVCSHLASDVPVGVLLSGGLDSSVVAAVAAQHIRPLHTFTVACPGAPDFEAARCVADYLGTIHHEWILEPVTIQQALPHIAYHLESCDRFLVRHAIPTWFACALAAQRIGTEMGAKFCALSKLSMDFAPFRVLLVGEGADELFGGYDYWQKLALADPVAARNELDRSLRDLHWTNLQRVDRMSMGHGVECRVPFLQRDVVAFARSLPIEALIGQNPVDGTQISKYLLRLAFESALPPEIIWGKKRQFAEGAGFPDLWDQLLREEKPLIRAHRRRHRHIEFRTDEEALFHFYLYERFGADRALWDNIVRWHELMEGKKPPFTSSFAPRHSFWEAARRLLHWGNSPSQNESIPLSREKN
ncbi:MAG: asparagine synthase (glutamine-hydrolyzing) [Candidatus Sumerlaea chitinivorans]|nr:asparagine synthase (glutamine-hydrolyzing) [Candidatus Sumerlaea chitinivorans]